MKNLISKFLSFFPKKKKLFTENIQPRTRGLPPSAATSEGDDGRKELEEVKLHVEKIEEAKASAEARVLALENEIKGIEEGKEREISSLKKKMVDLDAVITSGGLELSKEKEEKKTLEDALNISNIKVGELAIKLIVLQKLLGESEIAIVDIIQTIVQPVNEMVEMDATLVDEGSNNRTMNMQWAMGATVAFVGGIVGLQYARTRCFEAILPA